jgi:class 3 adenylate cyclase
VRARNAFANPPRTVVLLFTDIEGSTKRWEANPTAMAAALREHDALLRRAIEKSGGRVFKTVGDAFYALFERASDAVAAAIEGQRAIERRDWTGVEGLRVRMAVHAGTVDERDGDVFGPTVNRVARLVGIAHGGQILLSGSVAALVHGEVPAGATLSNLGEHRLKDLSSPELVFQVAADGLQSLFPPCVR